MLLCVTPVALLMPLTPRERAIKHIGPRPEGEPDQMEQAANELKKIASEFATQSLAMKATKIDGAGGVVTRNNARAMKRGSHLRLRGERLERLAGQITSAAAEIRQAQTRWDTRLDYQMKADAA